MNPQQISSEISRISMNAQLCPGPARALSLCLVETENTGPEYLRRHMRTSHGDSIELRFKKI